MESCVQQRNILASLNENQRKAVTAPCSGILQIIAGPGTGKTKVIVCRVAYLLLHEGVPPERIIVTTFTKKAADEMMSRLRELLEGTGINVRKLLMGTFHSICYKLIQMYGSLINVDGFTIADERDSSAILSDVLINRITDEEWSLLNNLDESVTAQFKTTSKEKYNGYDAKKIKRKISSAKSSGFTHKEYSASPGANKLLEIVYTHYQTQLQQRKLLDFDDCLLYCHRILLKAPVLSHIQHTLVDEFQDTNEIQLHLMYAFARGHPSDPRLQNNVTIVGDPDQSIYAFRDAQMVNFTKMRRYYFTKSLQCEVIILEQNYRSTSGILQLSESVMRQQSDRTDRTLHSQISVSFKPVKATFSSAEEEARWIALQIEYLTAFPDNIVPYSDIAVLVRTAFQTQVIESEFVRRKIPYHMVRGRAFWERKEVAVMVDYIRCVGNEDDRLAYMRTLTFPKRGFGPKALTDLEKAIDKYKKETPALSVFEILRMFTRKSMSILPTSLRNKLHIHLELINEARLCLENKNNHRGDDYSKAIDEMFALIYHECGLKAEFEGDAETELNIEEVKTQLMSFEFRDDVDSFEGPVLEKKSGKLFIKQFLESISLYDVDPGKVDDAQSTSKVSISTIHGAKGLEWPVVFVPGVSENLLPASFAIGNGGTEAVNEERRCLFVALTRAKHLLFISAYTETKKASKWGRKPITEVSRFLKNSRGLYSVALELNCAHHFKAFYGFYNREFRASQFDFEAHYDNYLKQMKAYVKKKKDEEPFTGFTTAGQVKRRKIEFQGPRKDTDKFEAAEDKQKIEIIEISEIEEVSEGGGVEAGPVSAPKKAPSYVPTKTKTTAVKPVLSTTSGASNKAPVYIPNKSGHKKRLGTR